jgi:[acyl-carrier-protein] S-malonyltransferase
VTPVSDRDVAVDCLTRQVEGRVRWRESIAWMQDHGITHCVELGHGKVITSMVRRPMKDALCANIQGKKDLDQLEGIFS